MEDLLTNEAVNTARAKAGSFNFNELDPSLIVLPRGTKLVRKEPFVLTNGPVYFGEWTADLR